MSQGRKVAATWHPNSDAGLLGRHAFLPPTPPCAPCRSADPRFNSGLQTLRVVDSRPLTGDSAASPRWINSLPFSDSDVTSRFTDKYPGGGSSDGSGVSLAGAGHGRAGL